MIGKGRFSYPLTLSQRERPDFLLTSNENEIGIEHTEAVPQNDAHKSVLGNKINGPDVHFLSHHKPGESRKAAKALIAEIMENEAGEGWAGDSVEREWADAMLHFINQKVSTAQKQGFERFDKDWLLIYDNWSLPALQRAKATQFLLDLTNKSDALKEFESIFIITGKYLCEITSGGTRLHDIVDLWN